MPNVYVTDVQTPENTSLSKASEFGEVKYLFTQHIGQFRTEKLLSTIAEGMENSSAEDFLILCGPINRASFVLTLWMMKHTVVNLLLYDKRRFAYTLRRIEVAQLEDILGATSS
jgi:hypothetical protein